jgi:DNA processing protein
MSQHKYWIALASTKGIGTASLTLVHQKLAELQLSITDIFDLDGKELQHELGFSEKLSTLLIRGKDLLPKIDEDYTRLIEAGINTTLLFDESYPRRLAETMKNTAPPVLYTFGEKSILQKKSAAVLGYRDVSDRGEMISFLASRELSRHDIPVTSGFSRGAGYLAHRGALEHGGNSIAVLPHGMFHLNVPETLAEIMDLTRFCFVSPFYPADEYSVYNSYNRNSIICAMAMAVYIVEAPEEGGIFEAGKSAVHHKTPLFVTEYVEYPDSARGNPLLIKDYGAIPVRGRKEQDLLVPNLDALIGKVKWG